MTRFGWIVSCAIVLIALIAGGALWVFLKPASEPSVSTIATSTSVTNPADLSIYSSGEYGFSIFYPSDATITDAFSEGTTTEVIPWRLHPIATGTPIVRIEEGGKEVRVGISTDAKELASCLRASPGEESRGSFTVGKTAWQEFMFEKLGTEREAMVTSYRIVQNSACYAVEVLVPSGKTATSTAFDISQSITSFTFSQ